VPGAGSGARKEIVRRVALTSAAAVCLSLTALTGCGSAAGPAGSPGSTSASASPKAAASPLQAVQAAYTKTSDERSMQFVLEGKFSSTGMSMAINASGVEDVSTKAADITMTMPIVGKMEMRLVDGVAYAKLDGDGTGGILNTDGKWIKVDDQEMADSLGADSSFDADEMLQLLKGTSSSGVTDKGSATVRGVQTTHYAAQLDIAKLAAIEGDSFEDSDVQSMMKETGMSSLPIDLYIDAQGRVRRLGMSMTMKDTPSASPSSSEEDDFPMSGTFSMTVDFFNFGLPVHITAPAPSEITDGAGLLDGLDDSTTTES
jgi:hypothetical protein